MPSKYSVKIYIPNGFYHVYNRGVNKQLIFVDLQDYRVFLTYLKSYILPKDEKRLQAILLDEETSAQEKEKARSLLRLNNFFNSIHILAYCLMPNHYHLVVQQTKETDIEGFMKSLMTRYTQYFNKKYKRIGPVYQGRYKAVPVETDDQLLHLTRYVHRNPLVLERTVLSGDKKIFGQPSSYPVYLSVIQQRWVKSEQVLQHFAKTGYSSYEWFVEDQQTEIGEKSSRILAGLFVDDEFN